MKAAYAFLAAMAALVVLALPVSALAHDHDGWHHDHGRHNGWYKHQGWDGGGNPGYWHHREHEWREHEWREHHPYGGYGYGYGGGYPGNMVCDDDGDDCRPAPPIAVPGYSGYDPGSYYGSGYFGSSYAPVPYGSGLAPGAYGSGFAPNTNKLMQLRQTMTQRLSTSQALYQAAMARGNYALANKMAARMKNQSATINGANAMLGGGGAAPGYSTYYQPGYGANPYYGQAGASPLTSVLQMFGY